MEKALKQNKINAINFMKKYRDFCNKQKACYSCCIFDDCKSSKACLTDSEIENLVEIIEKSN